MARKRKRSRIYWRSQGGQQRAYADFRDFSDVGGKREALRPKGGSLATTDPVIVEKLVLERLQELQERRRNREMLGVEREARLLEFAARHLDEKSNANFEYRWLRAVEGHLRAAVEFFGADRELTSVRTRDVKKYVAHLRTLPNGRGGKLSDSSVRKYLNSLSNLYRKAQSDEVVPQGYNPVAALVDKPTDRQREADFLEVPDAALLLEAARLLKPNFARGDVPIMYAIIGTLLLTGGRKSEVLGLEVEDVSFDRRTITFRPNRWRRLKTASSHRAVPLWPQLEEILREYVFGGDEPLGSLLFPSRRVGSEIVITDLRKSLDAIAAKAGQKAGEIRTRIFRHTYCATRLQTLDRGEPISEYTVGRELGHGGRAMVERVYGHLGTNRHRSEQVEYRIEQHTDVLGERLAALRAQR